MILPRLSIGVNAGLYVKNVITSSDGVIKCNPRQR